MTESIPEDLVYLLTTNVLAHVSALRRDHTMAHYLMWVDYDGRHVLTSSFLGSRKARNWSRDSRVTLSVVDKSDDWRYLIIRGRVTATRPDEGLAFIDKLSMRYTGAPYRRRDAQREIFVIEPEWVRASRGRG